MDDHRGFEGVLAVKDDVRDCVAWPAEICTVAKPLSRNMDQRDGQVFEE